VEIRFYFDFISPYAYLAWTQAPGMADAAGVALTPVPVLFAGLLEHHGHLGPAEMPAKRAYVIVDVARKARELGVPVDAPPAHPFNPLLALRVASLPLPADRRRRVIDGLYRAVWAERRNVEAPEEVAGILRDAGEDGPALVAGAGDPENKARLRAQTEEAIARGVFGVPTAVTDDGELFWGVDALGPLGARMRGAAGPVDHALVERWRDLPATASRPRRG